MKDGDSFEGLLDFLKVNRGFDFTGYKRPSLRRRIDKRMKEVGVESYSDYVTYLEANPGEFSALFDTILINVTAFFRDPDVWKYMRSQVLPGLIESDSGAPFRVWVAGCATGEEPYSVAVALAEAMGASAFEERVKIYATDVDEDALTTGRHATYTASQLESLPDELRDRYFDRTDHRFVFLKELRHAVIFGRNDLLTDAPISKVDLLVCRNTLMYFNADIQKLILKRFHFALKDEGVLCLGKSEMLLGAEVGFTPVDLKNRVFRRVPQASLRRRAAAAVTPEPQDPPAEADGGVRPGAFDQAPLAQLVVNRDGVMVLANQQARRLFGLTATDRGRPLTDLSVAYTPLELPAAIDRVCSDRRELRLGPAPLRPPTGKEQRFEGRIGPLIAANGSVQGAIVTYVNVTEYGELQGQLEESQRELQDSYEELQSTVEELETTNEELQSTNEELETTNEELQSASEELETTNEELQSANEEMETTNEELTRRTSDLEQMSGFMDSVLASLDVGVVVVEPDLTIRVWNRSAEQLWGLRVDEVEQKNLLGLDIGLPVEQLRKPVQTCLNGSDKEELTLAAVDRRGKEIECRVTCLPLRRGREQVAGAVLLMEVFA